MQEAKRRHISNEPIIILKKDFVALFNQFHSVFYEWNSISDKFSFKANDFDKRISIFEKSEIDKNDFINFFTQSSQKEFQKIISEHINQERISHRLISEIEFEERESCLVLNLGYSIKEEDKITIRGILLKLNSNYEKQDYINEIKRILGLISDYSQEEFWIRDLDLNYLYLSKPFSKVFQYSAEELLKTSVEKLYTPESIYYLKHNIEELIQFEKSRKLDNGKSLILILKGFSGSGKIVWTEESFNFIRTEDDQIIGYWGITRDVTNKIKTDQVKEALYKISEYSHLTSDLNDFFNEVHSVIKAIMPANNFSICLYEKENEFISCPYSSNSKQQKNLSHKFSNGLIEYAITSGKPLHLDKNSLEKLVIEKKLEPLNEIPESWIGIPLKIKKESKGLLIVESFSKQEIFTQEDFDNLKFVADQTSMVIERKINEAEKLKIKSLLEAVSKAQSILLTKRDVFLGIQLAFEQIGQIINVSRISLYENINDIPNNIIYARLLVDWTLRNEFQKDSIEQIDFTFDLKRWLNEFYLGNNIKDIVRNLPLNEYNILKYTKAKSILCIPIFLTKKLWGFIKFDDCKNERLWSEQEISVLSVVAASIGGIFQRKIAEETLKTSEEKYRNYINNSMEGISLLQFTEPVDINLPIEEQIDKFYEFGFVAEANDSLAKMYGLNSAADIIGESLIEIHGGTNIEKNREAFRSFILNGYKVINVETIEKKIDGTEIVFLNNSIGILSDNKLKAIWGSQIDITDRKRFESELKSAKEKAEEANRIKTNFLSNMSHELRTPLIGILGYAEILMEEFKNTPHEDMASIIFQSGNRLLETLNSILTISKIESEKFSVKYKYFDLNLIIKEVVSLFQSIANKKNILIETHCSNDNMTIYSDVKIIREILNNLVNNAVKFTKSGSVIIQASINLEINKLFLSVSDTGIGIPEDKLEIIFEEFRQASEGLARNFEGVGLGLAICKKYVDILKGNISVKSKLNQGSTFIVEIPLNKEE